MAEFWKLPAHEVQKKLGSGEITLEQYVLSLLGRIEDREPLVKAWSYLDRDYILREARRLDSVPVNERGPLHGIVIGVKDVFLTKDMPTGYGSLIFKDHPVQNVDAGPIMTLRAQGALFLGKLHTTEFAATTDGPVTRNPHHPERTPGGSSSGSGAAVGDFHVPIALGTQTLGSVIRPGSYNGCYAYKPTWGSVSREGLAVLSITLDTCGMFSRSVADLNILADALRLKDDLPPKTFVLKGANIGFCQTPVWQTKATPALEAAWAKAKDLLAQRGASIKDVTLPADFARIPAWHDFICRGEGRVSFLGQYLFDKKNLHEGLAGFVDEPNLSRKELLEAYDGCARLRPVFDAIAAEYDIVITPTAPDEAPEGYKTGDGSFCLTWSSLHVPVVNVPGFAGRTGLPLGMSLVGPRYSDRQVLTAAAVIGEVFESEGGWKHAVF